MFIDSDSNYPENVGCISCDFGDYENVSFHKYWTTTVDVSKDEEAQIIAEYKRLFNIYRVVINDISKEAWLEDRFGQPLKDEGNK